MVLLARLFDFLVSSHYGLRRPRLIWVQTPFWVLPKNAPAYLITDSANLLLPKCFLPPFSHTSLLYTCFAPQTALLGFYHDFSLFTSPVTSIHAGARDERHCERKSACGRVPKNIRALKSSVMPRFKPRPPAWQGECFIHCTMPCCLNWSPYLTET